MGNNIKIYMIGTSADHDMYDKPFSKLNTIVEDDTRGAISYLANGVIYELPFDTCAFDVTEFYVKDAGWFNFSLMLDKLYYYKGKRSDKHMYFLVFDVDDNDDGKGTLVEIFYIFSLSNIVSLTIKNGISIPLHEEESDSIITAFKLDIGCQSDGTSNIEIYAVATNAGNKIYENPFGTENTNIELGAHGTIKDMVNSVRIYGVTFPDIAFSYVTTKFYNGNYEDGVLDIESMLDEFDSQNLPKKHVYFLVFKVDNDDRNNGTLVEAIYMFSKDTLISLSNGETHISPAEIKLHKGLFVLPDDKQPHSLSIDEYKSKPVEVEMKISFKCFPITNDEVNAAAARLLEAFKGIDCSDIGINIRRT